MQQLAQLSVPFGTIDPPPQLSSFPRGADGLSLLLYNMIFIFFSTAALAFVIMFLWGAIQMILSQGDKEAIAKARAKITWAIIGIFLMALSYFIFAVLEDITGFKFFL